MYNPIATYRLQFHKGFTFTDFDAIIPYLQKLGVSTVYASPIFESVPGSNHGYDVIDPLKLNPEIGTKEQLYVLSEKLKLHGIGWIQDIVPNHMAFHPANSWLMDVLEKGRRSVYASFFDIQWESGRKLMVPFLDGDLETVIERGDLKIEYSGQRLVFKYFDQSYPLCPRSYTRMLEQHPEAFDLAIQGFISQVHQLQQTDGDEVYREEWHELQIQLAALLKTDPEGKIIRQSLQRINGSRDLLKLIADEQEYELCDWRETDTEINYRRFFTVNSLICLNIHQKKVFDHCHQLIHRLVCDGVFQGLRVDHIDGLFDPEMYVDQLRVLVGDETYITVEKILQENEHLPSKWPVEGTTGYDFLAIINNLFIDKKAEKKFTDFYDLVSEAVGSLQNQIYEKKSGILYQYMQGEHHNLCRLFLNLDLTDEMRRKASAVDIKEAIGEFLIRCPVYRFYGNRLPLKQDEATAVLAVLNGIRANKKHLKMAVDLLEHCLLKTDAGGQDRAYFYQRLMQFSGPLMAKGVEDTLMYTFNKFIGNNDVGDSPTAFGLSFKRFHQKMAERQERWPLSLNATSTHDSKRGEDVRARLNALTALADEWFQHVRNWKKINAPLKRNNDPDPNDEYFLYQTLVGSYPLAGDLNGYENRIQEYLEKVVREAKNHSTWVKPDLEYEQSAKSFAVQLLNEKRPFWKSFRRFYQSVADLGGINALAQVLFKFTAPGVPDVYQGCELFDLSLVDPDNRRPVDFQKRAQWLNEFDVHSDQENLITRLWADGQYQRLKLWLVQKLFHLRKENSDIFLSGFYVPLKVKGKYKKNFLAFARRYKNRWIIAGAPVHLPKIKKQKDLKWKDTRVVLPAGAPETWRNLIAKQEAGTGSEIFLQEVISGMPLVLLEAQYEEKERGAGVLLAISSLPSPLGIGDLGPGAFAFADFLGRSGQKYWQLLPLNPTEQRQQHSPYSSVSSMAGNTLFISPDEFAENGFLTKDQLKQCQIRGGEKINYRKAEKVKRKLFKSAWNAFKREASPQLRRQFLKFCTSEDYWLSDFALYTVLKRMHDDQPWYLWPEALKFRDTTALDRFAAGYSDEIEKEKWLQFQFFLQWGKLESHCHGLGIKMLGDLPYYVSYDSTDVWANRHIFNLDKNGDMITQAGVPPDYFNEDGQLWGMPVFRWDVVKKEAYDWWLKRIKRNLELYDLLRLDHFRAFGSYWEVPAGAMTAKDGRWKEGPGSDFFRCLRANLGDLPLVAEDLGDIDLPVYRLRDEFNIPGMRVLQFAFGEDMAESLHAPHNYTRNCVVYTGTHDNNTSRGWLKKGGGTQMNITKYTGIRPGEKSVHLVLGQLAYASVARIAILPMQDVLGLDDASRMNTPASNKGNWLWRLKSGQADLLVERRLREWTKIFNR